MNKKVLKHQQDSRSHFVIYPLSNVGNCYLTGICLDCGNFVSVNLFSKLHKKHVLVAPAYPSIEHYFLIRKIYQENQDVLSLYENIAFLNEKINEQNQNIHKNMMRRLKIKDAD